MTVLVVDDRADVAALAADMVQTLGYPVLTAHSGQEALRVIDAHPDVRLLFSDVVMPGMNGVQLARTAKTKRPHLQVLLTSGFTESTIEKIDADGTPFEFVPKPYRLKTLSEQFKRLLGQPEPA